VARRERPAEPLVERAVHLTAPPLADLPTTKGHIQSDLLHPLFGLAGLPLAPLLAGFRAWLAAQSSRGGTLGEAGDDWNGQFARP
jgi:hypothetical protein